MAYESLSEYQNTTNYSQRDIDQKFNLVEFNRIFEQNNLNLSKNNIQDNLINCPAKNDNPDILLIIVCSVIILGILLLLFNYFFNINSE